jgi:hypothetical protein
VHMSAIQVPIQSKSEGNLTRATIERESSMLSLPTDTQLSLDNTRFPKGEM